MLCWIFVVCSTKPSSSSKPTSGDNSDPAHVPEENFDEPPPTSPAALGRIHKKLSTGEGLVKLHWKHDHMNPDQFKFRTSALHRPKDVHDLYDQVVLSCETCQKNNVGSTRSKVNGFCPEIFGEMSFIDHCDVIFPTNEKIGIFIILDGATTLSTAYPVMTKTDVEPLKFFKEYVSTYYIQPKYVVGDGAFMGLDWKQYYQHFDIRPVTLGAMTPWPNRAETVVRLFKR